MEKRKKCVNTDKVAKPSGVFSHATVWSGKEEDVIFVSGMTARGIDGEVAGDDIEAQTRQCLENLKFVLAGCGADMDDVMRVTVYVTNTEGLSTIQRVRAEYWPDPSRYPASTIVAVKGLAKESFLIEIEAIACRAK